MKTKYLILLSEIIDKMGIKEELKSLEINTGNEKKDQEELGKELITLLATRIYKCEKEVYKFVAHFKGYYPNEIEYSLEDTPEIKKEKLVKYEADVKEALKKAENENIFDIFKELGQLEGIENFLSIA